MKSWLTRVRVLAAGGILILSFAFSPALPAAAERPSNAGQLLFWLLRLHMVREQGRPWKVDVNSATGLSPHLIERLAPFLTVDPDWPSALPGPPRVPRQR
jgi:hypothetical protein